MSEAVLQLTTSIFFTPELFHSMPRKASSSASRPAASTSLGLSQLHLRLEGLEKEHKSLLNKIKRKRTELNNFVEQMRSLATEIFHRSASSYQKVQKLDEEIHALFEEIFARRKFGKQTRKNIEKIYQNLQMAGIITPKVESFDADTELDELFETPEEEEEFSREQSERRFYDREEQEPESDSASRNENSRKIRQTFLKLAEIFHPDKVTDSETQMRHTEIMKEINKAYQEGDIARLLEIEQKYQVGELIDTNSEDDLTKRCDRLQQQNEILNNQYETLKRELRQVKNTPEGALVADYRKASKQGIDMMAEVEEEIDSQVQVVVEIRDFVKDFRDQKITIKEFTEGPEALRSMKKQMMEEMLEEMFGDLRDMMGF